MLTENAGRLLNTMRRLVAVAEKKNGFFDLVMDYDYDEPETKILLGYSLDGYKIVTPDQTGKPVFEVSYADVVQACEGLGIGLYKQPEKLPGVDFRYVYRFSVRWRIKLTRQLWEQKRRTEAMAEKKDLALLWERRFGAPPSPGEIVKLAAMAA